MGRWAVAAGLGGLLIGLLVGFLWWGRALEHVRADLATLQERLAAAEAARERVQSLEAELKAERERRQNLERALSAGRK
ncbi:MAG TPA: hypothetical protein VNK50_05235 [Calidithermus sp.]|jgi:hypothetical protein|nr:hypothetical protein [Calidithermus sp.]